MSKKIVSGSLERVTQGNCHKQQASFRKSISPLAQMRGR